MDWSIRWFAPRRIVTSGAIERYLLTYNRVPSPNDLPPRRCRVCSAYLSRFNTGAECWLFFCPSAYMCRPACRRGRLGIVTDGRKRL